MLNRMKMHRVPSDRRQTLSDTSTRNLFTIRTEDSRERPTPQWALLSREEPARPILYPDLKVGFQGREFGQGWLATHLDQWLRRGQAALQTLHGQGAVLPIDTVSQVEFQDFGHA